MFKKKVISKTNISTSDFDRWTPPSQPTPYPLIKWVIGATKYKIPIFGISRPYLLALSILFITLYKVCSSVSCKCCKLKTLNCKLLTVNFQL